ncbi:hypothetical protein BDC45DRAFT_575844 [Circinella umbellata]|nr:hypothetical protein BDC45DRAFT_575844 [Circinella umbellata]
MSKYQVAVAKYLQIFFFILVVHGFPTTNTHLNQRVGNSGQAEGLGIASMTDTAARYLSSTVSGLQQTKQNP